MMTQQTKPGEIIELIQKDGNVMLIHVNDKGIAVETKSTNARIITFQGGTHYHVRTMEIPKGHERFSSRGIGSDNVDCFVCGKKCPYCFSNISGFVASKETGTRIVDMFLYGAKIDSRPSEPSWIQVKVGACKQHQINLSFLHQLVADGFINIGRVKMARGTE